MNFKRQDLMPLLIGIVSLAAYCSCAVNKAKPDNSHSAFSYREVFLPEALGDNAINYGLNNVENDWGIWGHNLKVVLPEKPSTSIYAKKGGTTNRSQFCFSSKHLFEYVCDYIDKYDDDEQIRFAILPNDNNIVCVCSACVAEGNTKRDASPAVIAFIEKLAAKYPQHLFFTSHYTTTKKLPSKRLPDNVGVTISAMDYPLSSTGGEKETEFIDVITGWKSKTDKIMVWDYINNFDDYFTPFPVFDIMQRRLKLYKDNGVTGVFLNGSGNYYSAFSNLKTAVLAEMTNNPDVDWKTLLKEKASEIYPKSGDIISEFILFQEDFVHGKGDEMPLYDGVSKAIKTYLPVEEFKNFHDKILEIRTSVSGKEREELDRLCGELALTRMELNRVEGNVDHSWKYVDDLKFLDSHGGPYYSESAWKVERYIQDYSTMMQHHESMENINLLKGRRLNVMTALDPDYSDVSLLTDGLLGIPSNYHSGNLIMSPEPTAVIAIPGDVKLKKLRVCLSYNPPYRIGLPQLITLYSNNRVIDKKEPEYPSDSSGHVFVEFDIPSNSENLLLNITKDDDTHAIAIDEIEGW